MAGSKVTGYLVVNTYGDTDLREADGKYHTTKAAAEKDAATLLGEQADMTGDTPDSLLGTEVFIFEVLSSGTIRCAAPTVMTTGVTVKL